MDEVAAVGLVQRQAGQAHANEAVERARDRKRLERVDIAFESAGDLQCEERVPARTLVNPDERLTREGPAQPIAEQAVNGSDTERPDLDALGRKSGLQL